MELSKIIEDMKQCEQTKGQSVYDHGISVRDHLEQLIDILGEDQPDLTGWKIPECILENRERILDSSLLPWQTLNEYAVYHDCGKPYCKTVDDEGRVHFSNHAQVSHDTWIEAGGDEQVGRLILWDMDIHTMKAADVPAFCERPEAASLMLAGIAEIHSNAKMFGGIDSTSFKIKWKKINQRAKAICKILFKE